ncbi:MAG TPA: conjugative transposon protein TraN [Bacteroidia bacterium]|nr:conjugative transposon protein TraN [Bacteroidia bacterium]
MKKNFILVLFLSLTVFVKGQTTLCISTDKTTSLIFPFAIKHVDRGSQSILAQQIKDVPTILLVKAAANNFTETNLSVVTDDGSLYSFVVCYDLKPASWVHYLPVNSKATTAMYANAILDNQRTIKGIKDKKWQSVAAITGIYIKEDVLFYQLTVENYSAVDYTIDFIRFLIRDKKKGKRTAVQEIELKPQYTVGNTTNLKANSKSVMVFALEKHTIPDVKKMLLQISEKNGGRHFNIKLKNKNILKAITLPDFK